MSDKKLKILVTNDDGIDSPGLNALAEKMKELGEVIVAAPKRQQSAVSHALNISYPLRVKKVNRDDKFFGYAISGTPADCVKIAIAELIESKPDLVVSGINHGQNTSINVMYSGTIAAATEGMLLGIPSMAVSLGSHDPGKDCSAAAEYSLYIAKKILDINLPENTLINVNVPAVPEGEIKGIRIVKQSKTIWTDHYEKRIDPFGREYYWFAGDFKILDKSDDTDEYALEHSYVSVTPIHFDLTNRMFIDKLKFIENNTDLH